MWRCERCGESWEAETERCPECAVEDYATGEDPEPLDFGESE